MVVRSGYRGSGQTDAISLWWIAGVGIPAVVDSSAVADLSSTLPRNSLVESLVSSCTKLTNVISKRFPQSNYSDFYHNSTRFKNRKCQVS
jgi:hypothetical protein